MGTKGRRWEQKSRQKRAGPSNSIDEGESTTWERRIVMLHALLELVLGTCVILKRLVNLAPLISPAQPLVVMDEDLPLSPSKMMVRMMPVPAVVCVWVSVCACACMTSTAPHIQIRRTQKNSHMIIAHVQMQNWIVPAFMDGDTILHHGRDCSHMWIYTRTRTHSQGYTIYEEVSKIFIEFYTYESACVTVCVVYVYK